MGPRWSDGYLDNPPDHKFMLLNFTGDVFSRRERTVRPIFVSQGWRDAEGYGLRRRASSLRSNTGHVSALSLSTRIPKRYKFFGTFGITVLRTFCSNLRGLALYFALN